MEATVLGISRGNGKAYVKIRVTDAPDGTALNASAIAEGDHPVPCGLFDLQAEGSCGEYVVMLPLLKARWQKALLQAVDFTGKAVQTCQITINPTAAKWQSRMNTLLNRQMVHQIRDIDEQFIYDRICVKLVRLIDDCETVIARISATMPDAPDMQLDIKVLDALGQPLQNAQVTRLADIALPAASAGAINRREALISVRMPKTVGEFCVWVRDTSGAVAQGFLYLEDQAFGYELGRYADYTRSAQDDPDYPEWFEAHRATDADIQHQRTVTLENPATFSMVVYGDYSEDGLDRTLESIAEQSFGCQETIVVLDGAGAQTAQDRYAQAQGITFAPTMEKAIEAARASYIAFAQMGDRLTPNALFEYACNLATHSAQVVYCDEDCMDEGGLLQRPFMKPVWSPELERSCHYVAHMLVVSAGLAKKCASEPLLDGACYDLTLRATEQAKRVQHIAQVLYHALPQHAPLGIIPPDEQLEAGRLALKAQVKRAGGAAIVDLMDKRGLYRVDCHVKGDPSVSIVIPNRDSAQLLNDCVSSILEKSTYGAYDIIIVENNSADPETFKLYDALEADHKNVHVVRFEGPAQFNYSKLINFGVAQSKADYVLLLNNDTQVITPDFIQKMLGFFQFDGVGVVGAKLLYPDDTVQHAGVVIGRENAAGHLHYGIPDTADGYFCRANCIQDLSCVTGACQLVPRAVFDQVGGYTEEYAVGYNDVDFCLKMVAAGKRVVFTPYAKLHHFEFASRGYDETPDKKVRAEKERALLRYNWADVFALGDAYYNVNLNSDNLFFELEKRTATD